MPLLNAVGALLLAEAGGVGGEGLGELVLGVIWSMNRPIH
jgi:hypothetical protein